jgi:hypothetical protein
VAIRRIHPAIEGSRCDVLAPRRSTMRPRCGERGL